MAVSAAVGSIIAAVVAAAASVTTAAVSSHQADKANKRQIQYQQQIAQQEADAAAKEKRLQQEAQARSKAYGASLLDSDTNTQNMLNEGGYGEDKLGSSGIISESLQKGNSVQSMFS